MAHFRGSLSYMPTVHFCKLYAAASGFKMYVFYFIIIIIFIYLFIFFNFFSTLEQVDISLFSLIDVFKVISNKVFQNSECMYKGTKLNYAYILKHT